MPLARVGATIVLFANVMFESAVGYDQIARLSSPVPRMKLFFTVQLEPLPLKLTPSASVDSMTLFSTVQLLLPNCSHMPTLVSWIHSPFTVQPLPSEPSMALAVLSSCRPTVLPRIAKPLRLIGPETAEVLSMSSFALSCEYQSPAPSIVPAWIFRCELTRKVPLGIQTASPAEFAAVIAWLNAEVESLTPVGSAP